MTETFESREDYDEFHAVHPRPVDQTEFLAARTAARSLAEFDLLATRLLGTEPELHAEVDRLRAEAELRYQLIPALIFAAAALAATWNALVVLFALPAAVIFYMQATRAGEAAGDLVADAVLLGRATPPAVDRVVRLAEEAAATHLATKPADDQ